MNIIGEKIVLRALEDKDNEMLFSIINDPSMEYLLGGWSFPISKENQKSWFDSLNYNDKELRCAVEILENGETIGVVMLTGIDYKNGNAEIHIKLLNNEYRKKGFGTEAIMCLVKYAFNELRLHTIYAMISEHNITSKKLFEKCGFAMEGLLKDRLYKKGKYINILSYSVVKSEVIC